MIFSQTLIKKQSLRDWPLFFDLKKPLESHVKVAGRFQRVEYEGPPKICYKCGHYGHTQEYCRDSPNAQPDNVNVDMVRSPVTNQNPPNPGYGPWMQAPRRNRRRPLTDVSNQTTPTIKL